MAKTQTVKANFTNESTNKKWSKNFTGIPNGTFANTGDVKTQLNNYKKIVDGTFTGGELHTVEPFDAA